jgi:hypothetical protein
MTQTSNWFEWQEYVNGRIDELMEFKRRREADLTMENMRLRRLLDATLQRLGESETFLQPEVSDTDMPGTVRMVDGHMQSSSSVGTSE